MATKKKNKNPLYIKPIPGFTLYYATVEGIILKKVGDGFIKLNPSESHNGYKTVNLPHDNGGNHRRKVHRLIALTFIPNPHNYPIVCHRDNNPENNHVDNLYWGTQSMNMQQIVMDGRQRKSKVRAYYTPKVLALYMEGFSASEILSSLPNLSSTTLYRIIKRYHNGQQK